MMLLAYAGHLFIANAELINLVHILKQTKNKFVVLDSNDNPMMVEKPEEFLDKLIEKNQEALNTYNQLYQDSITKG
jgi:predicted amidohydrolase YtcJ